MVDGGFVVLCEQNWATAGIDLTKEDDRMFMVLICFCLSC